MPNPYSFHFRWPKELPIIEKTYIVSKFFIWIVKNIIIVSLKAFLYPSKMSGRSNEIFFFPKKVIDALFQKNSYIFSRLPENAAVQGKVKLLPKKTEGVRPLFIGVNDSLGKEKVHNSKLLLRYLTYKEQGFTRPGSFMDEWRNALSVLGKEGALYFVKTDIKDAFGSVDTSKLEELLHYAVENLRFFEFRKYVEDRKEFNTSVAKGKKVFYCQMSEKRILDETKFRVFLQECVSTIEAALHPAVMYGTQKVTIASGLPQGCCLSSDLLEFYYSKLTSMFLDELTTDGKGVLLRAVDDFLYLSRSKEKARCFKDRMLRGIPEFNCFVNKSKTITNCNSKRQRVVFNGFTLCFTRETVLLNTSSLAIIPSRYSMTFNNTGKKSSFIMRKLLQVTGSRLPYHLISQRYSDLNTLLDNVWRLGMHCGLKIDALVDNARDDTVNKYNSRSIVTAILGVANKTFARIERSRSDTQNLANIFQSVFICSICCTVTVVSRNGHKALTRKLKNIARCKIKTLNSMQWTRVLQKYLD